eukprot:Nitzschia sp. Nitz4//scaffold50_size126154//86506//87774//NITZ4_003693-RA/size126154-processed-gene-0.61-mRNA-1//-1//CDS//3329553722//4196//frame0
MSEEAAAASLQGTDIAKLLRSSGPVVQCVLLQAGDGKQDTKPEATTDKEADADADADTTASETKVLLPHLMKQIEVDTTPSKSMVAKTLGGAPITFLGQYEDEGIMLIVRSLPEELPPAEDLQQESIALLKELCQERDIDILPTMLEKRDLVDALLAWEKETLPPINPHVLQPPLHRKQVRGDIVVLKVAETKEELDQEEEEADATATSAAIEVPTNDEFFLDYTLEEYLKFAARTDIPEVDEEEEDDEEEEGVDEDDEEEEEEEGDDDDQDPPYEVVDPDDMDEEDKSAMFNLVMNEVLRQYREEHGRGPNTQELLELRSTIAKELKVQVAEIDLEQADWNKNAKDGTPAKEVAKTIAFKKEHKIRTYQPDPNEYPTEEYSQEDEDDEAEEEDAEFSTPPTKRRKLDNDEPDSKPPANGSS